MVHIIAARSTEGLIPVMHAYIHIQHTQQTIFIQRYFRLRINENKKNNIPLTTPTCKPETANTCITPAAAKFPCVSSSSNDLSPKTKAAISCKLCSDKPDERNVCNALPRILMQYENTPASWPTRAHFPAGT